jgi:hypothetical protein
MPFPIRWKLIDKETGAKWKHQPDCSLSLTPDGSFVLISGTSDWNPSIAFKTMHHTHELWIALAKNAKDEWSYFRVGE